MAVFCRRDWLVPRTPSTRWDFIIPRFIGKHTAILPAKAGGTPREIAPGAMMSSVDVETMLGLDE